ncbi:DNA helicase [Desulfotomaculum copahuensis]|uniref:DNA helicase n=1 Tax=Desulfotomaculum copahuensis TaxID=1838280 RepID=A0A1B7LCZ4_9FIRM|nr:DNA helicase [Desulfotomaculum copahuensis]OAT80793.1 DNA helicase [Desulfotomaculum copahuensis]
MPTVIKTKPFDEDFLRLASGEQKQALKALHFLAVNPGHRSLHTHKIEGTEFFEAYVNMDVRIIFERTGDTIILHAIGHHDILRGK